MITQCDVNSYTFEKIVFEVPSFYHLTNFKYLYFILNIGTCRNKKLSSGNFKMSKTSNSTLLKKKNTQKNRPM